MKTGISKGNPIICKKCGHKVGYVRIEKPYELEKWLKKKKYRIWLWILIGAVATQIVSEIIGRLVLGDYGD